MTPLDWLNLVGGVSGIVGLAITTWTFVRVGNLSESLRKRFLDRHLTEKIERFLEISKESRKTLSTTQVQTIEAGIIHTVEHAYLSPWPWRDRRRKSLVVQLKEELRSKKRLDRVQQLIDLLRFEILVR